MLQIDQTESFCAEDNVLPSIDEQKYIRPNMIYHILPTMVSDRIPTIPWLRKSLNDVRSRSLHSKSPSLTESLQLETPPPGYTSRPGSGSVTPQRLSLALEDADFDLLDDASERPSSSRSALAPPFPGYETTTGINWKYASQGTDGGGLLLTSCGAHIL